MGCQRRVRAYRAWAPARPFRASWQNVVNAIHSPLQQTDNSTESAMYLFETLMVFALPVGWLVVRLSDRAPQYARTERPRDGFFVRWRWRSQAVPFINAAAWGLTAYAGRHLDRITLALVLLHTSILLLILVVDAETRLIPDVVIWPAILFACLAIPLDSRVAFPNALLAGVGGFLTFFLLAVLTRGGFALGDANLALYIGLITGHPDVWRALIYGIFIGGGIIVVLLLMRRVTLKTYVPYGPFLCLGAWLALLLQISGRGVG